MMTVHRTNVVSCLTLWHTWAMAPVVLAVILALALSACSSSRPAGTANNSGPQTTAGSSIATREPEAPQQPKASASTQTSEGGQVTVEVTWQGLSAGPVFTVALNTHSVNLDDYDLMKLAVLRTDQGVEIRPIGWDAPAGGHHRSGTLTFPAKAPDGSPLIGPGTRTVELVIREVAGVPERVFRWTP